MQIEDTKIGTAAVVGVTGRIDAEGSTLFEAHCKTLIGKGEVTFIFDFEDLEYLSSAGLRSILSIAKAVQPKSGKVIISGLKGPAKDIFDISGFSSMFPMAATIEDAAGMVL